MLYTEDFKKQVVKKVLSPGMIITEVAKKLKVPSGTIHKWKKIYAEEVHAEIVQINVDSLLYEEPVDIEKLLAKADNEPVKNECDQDILDGIRRNQQPGQYTNLEKYAIINRLRKLPEKDAGIFLRTYGIQSGHIRSWEEEILTMGKKQIDQNEIIRKQEQEIKLLKKQLKESVKENRELEILIELKKKYKNLFKEDGDE